MEGKRYRLQILPLFEDDLNEIVDYISTQLQNPTAAKNLVDAVQQAIEKRLSDPESFAPYRSAKERKYPYYQIFVKNFTIFYVVIGDVMEVRRILYGRRDWKQLL
jgi:plasmid stabilization system protein ParE